MLLVCMELSPCAAAPAPPPSPLTGAAIPLQVLDRTLVNVGGRHWWLNLLGRLKVQQLHQRHQRIDKALADLDNYALGATTHVKAGKDTSLRASIQTETLALRSGPLATAPSAAAAAAAAAAAPLKAGTNQGVLSALQQLSVEATVKRKLPEHEASATVALNQRSLDSTSQYVTTPFKVRQKILNSMPGHRHDRLMDIIRF